VGTTTIRISQRARREAHALAEATGRPMSQVVEDAIHAERERAFWRQFREAAAAVAGDPVAAAEERAELDLLEGSLMDGLEEEGVPQ
jgi:predicted transcriptional regulator